jgi:hypothetical protein
MAAKEQNPEKIILPVKGIIAPDFETTHSI